MARDLSGPQRIVQKYMDSQCRIVRDPSGFLDDTLDPDTLELADGDDRNVYAGACLVVRSGDRQVKIRLPIDSPRVTEGDRVIVLDSTDPRLRTRVFKVTEVERASLQVWRTLHCVDESAPETT